MAETFAKTKRQFSSKLEPNDDKIHKADIEVITAHLLQKRECDEVVKHKLEDVIKGAWWNRVQRDKRKQPKADDDTSKRFEDMVKRDVFAPYLQGDWREQKEEQ